MSTNTNPPASDGGTNSTDESDISLPQRHLISNAPYQPPATWSRFRTADKAVSDQQTRHRLSTKMLQTTNRARNQVSGDQQASTQPPSSSMSFADQVATHISAPDTTPPPGIKGLAGYWIYNLTFHVPEALRELSEKFKQLRESDTGLNLFSEPLFDDVCTCLSNGLMIDERSSALLPQAVLYYSNQVEQDWQESEMEEPDDAMVNKWEAIEKVVVLITLYSSYLQDMGVESEESGITVAEMRIETRDASH